MYIYFMRMAILLLLLLMSVVSNVYGQDPYKNFYYVKAADKDSIYFNDFILQDTNWAFLGDNISGQQYISEGCFHYWADSKPVAHAIEIPMDYNKDFEIKVSAKVEHRTDTLDDFGILFWGRKLDESINGEFLNFDNFGIYTIQWCNGKKDCKQIAFDQTKSVNRTGFNTYTIRKVSNSYYFFINGILYQKFPFKPLAGNGIGLGAKDVSVSFDYLKVYYIKKKV